MNAKEINDSFIEKSDPAFEDLLEYAWALFKQEKWLEAEKKCISFMQKKRFDSNAWSLIGLIEQKKNKHRRAISAFRAALAYGPDLHAVHYSLGVSLRLTGNIKAAFAHLEIARKAEPDISNYARELGITLFELGDYAQAEENLNVALASTQALHIVNMYLGYVAQKRKNYNVAIDYFNESIRVIPSFRNAVIAKAETLLELDDFRSALDVYLGLLRSNPNDDRIQLKCASLHFTLGGLGQAAYHAKKAISFVPGNIEAHILLGKILLSQGNITQAEMIFEKVMKMQPEDPKVLVSYAVLLERKGNIDSARNLIDKIKNEISGHPQLLMLLARLQTKEAGRKEVVQQITNRLNDDKPLNRDARAQLNFSIGTLLDRLNETESAFAHFLEGNRLRAHARNFDKQALLNEFQAIKNIFTKDFFAKAPRASINSKPTMIFIVGMPRSGTSLVEQILACHSQIFGVGEQLLFGRMIDQWFDPPKQNKQAHYTAMSEDISSIKLGACASMYHHGLPNDPLQHRYVVDKMPYNFMHVGMISLIFPEAKIIHCKRNAVDTSLSCFFQDFSEGNAFSYDLENCGWFYKQYESLMKHWFEVIDAPIYNNSYERLVANPEEEIRNLLEFCGLECEEPCLQFHRSGRIIHTASYQQVREPIYQRSVGKWRRYVNHLTPLLLALE